MTASSSRPLRLSLRLGSTFVLGLLIASAAACGGDDDGGGSSSAQTARGCAADDRKDVFAPGLTKTAGDVSVKLMAAAPAPPQKGVNVLDLELVDAGGQPIDGASIAVTPWMPDHAHGSAVTPVVTPSSGGKYKVTDVYLAMAGLWQLRINVTRAGGAAQEATFQFCVDG